jgi:hypothetical protein
LRQGVLRRARFPGVAACPCGSGSCFISKSTVDPRAGRIDLDFASNHGSGVFPLLYLTFDGESHSALCAELRFSDLTFSLPRP